MKLEEKEKCLNRKRIRIILMVENSDIKIIVIYISIILLLT
jgi:hypothetical protein